MRIAAIFFLVLFCVELSAQSDSSEKAKGSVQLEAGMFGDFFYTGISGPKMERLANVELPSWAPTKEPNRAEGNSSSLNTGYYTLSFQRPIRPQARVWWSAGISFLQRNITECSYQTDSIRNTENVLPATGDTIPVYEKSSWFGQSAIHGMQFNFPVGIRFLNVAKGKRWIQAGINLAPGFTFNHEYRESLSVITSTADASWSDPENSKFAIVEVTPVDRHALTKKLKGNYFTGYAGLPVNFCFRPAHKWQFILGFEPGYTVTQLDKETLKGCLMFRIGLGVKYLI
jgi:hypothetical protein